ncbi:DsbA family protein [Caldovatus aquaticus]|uniref:DsbA family protein n=1 Tax=Caldovatus aquaticus TaxID=2865671 RepID=A0ABS7F294_9PROT|nr:thioredoxin domain-containing protein [Caldovatus aquaticus]MBW8269742.1 DsbA family protein [Caldovatus aquaticus]
MTLLRRTLLLAGAGLGAVAAADPLAPARAQGAGGTPPQPAGADPRLAERSVGRPDAPVTVIEYFSLTCSHCGAFHRETYPRVRKELIETGQMRLVFRDFPLDQLALAAHCVARALPPDRYEGFLSALFAAQDRWAYARGADHLAEIAKIAAVAGMTREQVEAAARDETLQRAVLESRLRGERDHQVSATPTFVFGEAGKVRQSGNIGFERFAQLLAQARQAS